MATSAQDPSAQDPMTQPSSAPRPAGTPAWIDLTAHDLEGALRFYGDLFGWTFDDLGEETGHYRHALVDGRPVAGLMQAMDPSGAPVDPQAMPATWTVYLASDSLEETAESVTAAGGRVEVGPVDIADLGRSLYVADAAGAQVGLWEAREFPGFASIGGVGEPAWFECMSSDALVAEQFYRDALGWEISVMPGSGEGGFWYATNGAGEAASAGLCDASSFVPRGESGWWRMYIAVEDADAAAERVRELGGSLLDGPIDSPFGRVATVADPEGASFQIIQERARG